MATIGNLFQNSVNKSSSDLTKLTNKHTAGTQARMQANFDNYTGLQSDISADSSKNQKAIKNTKTSVGNSTNDKTAQSRAKSLALYLNGTKGVPTWRDYTVTGNAKENKNSISFKIKDANGKTGSAKITYGKDGKSRIEEITINGIKTTNVYDTDGKLREKTVINNSDKTTTVREYDATTGKINKQTITNTTTGAKKSINFYDDNGQLARQNKYNEDGKISSTIDYEYDKNGNKIGAYETIKSGSDKYGKVSAYATVYDGNKLIRTAYNEDGTSTQLKQTKNSNGKYVTDSKHSYSADGKLTIQRNYTNYKTNKDGTTTRLLTTTNKETGKTTYTIETLNADGKITESKQYSDKECKTLVKTTNYTYKNGIKTEEKVTDKNGKLASKTTFDSKTGAKTKAETYKNGDENKPLTTKKFNKDGVVTEETTRKYNENGKLTEKLITTNNDKGKAIKKAKHTFKYEKGKKIETIEYDTDLKKTGYESKEVRTTTSTTNSKTGVKTAVTTVNRDNDVDIEETITTITDKNGKKMQQTITRDSNNDGYTDYAEVTNYGADGKTVLDKTVQKDENRDGRDDNTGRIFDIGA